MSPHPELARIGMIARRYAQRLSDAELEARLADMVMILSAPRSGSTLLFDLLSRTPGIATIGGETHAVYRQFSHLAAENPQFDSGALDERHADPATVRNFRCLFLAMLRDSEGRLLHDLPGARSPMTIVEKTPRNALNLPFLRRVFPAARFVFLHRDPAQNVASLIEGWETGQRTGQFVTYRRLPEWDRDAWCFVLPRGWQNLRGKSLAEIAAFQWQACNEAILDTLGDLPADRLADLDYRELTQDPQAILTRIGEALAFDPGSGWTAENLPRSASTVSAPDPEKWRRRSAEVAPVLPALAPLMSRIEQWAARRRG